MFTQTRTYTNTPIFFEYAQEKRERAEKMGVNYSTYGTVMEGRNFVNDPYKFGYNGLEQHDEIMNNMVEAQFRFLNTSVGRWTSFDPAYDVEEESPYVSCYSNPIFWVDPEGLKPGGTIGPIGKFIEFLKHPFNKSERARYKKSNLHLPTLIEVVQNLFKPLRKLIGLMEGHKSQVERIPAGDYRQSQWINAPTEAVGVGQKMIVEQDYSTARLENISGLNIKKITGVDVVFEGRRRPDNVTIRRSTIFGIDIPVAFRRVGQNNIRTMRNRTYGTRKYTIRVSKSDRRSAWRYNSRFLVRFFTTYSVAYPRPWWHKWFYAIN